MHSHSSHRLARITMPQHPCNGVFVRVGTVVAGYNAEKHQPERMSVNVGENIGILREGAYLSGWTYGRRLGSVRSDDRTDGWIAAWAFEAPPAPGRFRFPSPVGSQVGGTSDPEVSGGTPCSTLPPQPTPLRDVPPPPAIQHRQHQQYPNTPPHIWVYTFGLETLTLDLRNECESFQP